MSGPSLFALLLFAPWTACRSCQPKVLHAVTMEGIPNPGARRLCTTACGLKGARIVASGHAGVQWPPRVASLPEGVTRCRDCYVATGKPRPVSRWVA